MVLSVIFRMELMTPGPDVLGDNYHFYNVLVTGHGLIMVFFFIMPALIGGFGNWLVPLMIGAPDMAFPRMNNISFWLLVPAFLLLVGSMFIGGVGAGWTIYRPCRRSSGIPTYRSTWRSSACTLPAPALLGAINFIATIFNMRAPGMTMHKMPLFAWSILVTAFLLLLAIPVLAGAITMLLTDRNFGTHFSIRRAAATRSCSSTCSGSSATPRSTS